MSNRDAIVLMCVLGVCFYVVAAVVLWTGARWLLTAAGVL